jgi:hypothetical protein
MAINHKAKGDVRDATTEDDMGSSANRSWAVGPLHAPVRALAQDWEANRRPGDTGLIDSRVRPNITPRPRHP